MKRLGTESRAVATTVVLLVFLTGEHRADAQCSPGVCRINTEAVNTYTGQGIVCSQWANLANAIADADGFRSGMLNASTNVINFQPGSYFTENSVWTSDFSDPEISGLSGDQDSLYWDRSGDAISYYAGHGNCGGQGTVYNGDSQVSCNSSNACNSPPANNFYPGFCSRYPGDLFGTCSYSAKQRAIHVGNCSTTGYGYQRQGNVVHGDNPATQVAWGESPWSGGWAGAGTNGGVNLVVSVSSCAERSNRVDELRSAFAGMHLMATVLVHTADTAMVADRGASFAMEYAISPYTSVADSWTYGMNSISQRNNFCANSAGTVSYGGGFGENGCGGHAITGRGATAAEANSFITENWYGLLQDYRDAQGRSYWSSQFICNYDCNVWPFAL